MPELTPSLVERLKQIRHFGLDLDGTLYLGRTVFPQTLAFLETLARLKIGRTFFTNNSSHSTAEYVRHLREIGIPAEASDFYTSTTSTLDYLARTRRDVKTVYVLGTPALRQEFAEAGYAVVEDGAPDAVIVGYDSSLEYSRLCRAAYWIAQGKLYLATNPDRVCPTDQPTVLPDCGSICKLLAHATGREPDAVLGKPAREMLDGVLQRRNLPRGELAIVGDRLYTDMRMAKSAGVFGVLVLSGETTREQVQASADQPDLVVAGVGELAEVLSAARR